MVNCGNCGAENSAEYSFCSSCGTALATSCPSCDTENPPGNKFCFNCGNPLGAAAPTAPATRDEPEPTKDPGERRLVSVLFADIVSYTTLSEGTDPEDIRSMLTDFYDRCKEIIGRFGGVTDKFIGDAVMGVWGATEAHEDDAERATRAALELVDMVTGLGVELGIDGLAARAGVLSGEASVGSGGNDHGLVVGDLVNTASRLQSIASPGKVFVGESTRTMVGSAIEFSSAGTHEVKGKTEPVAAYEAVRVLALSAIRRGGDLAEGPFVGRDDELRLLKDQLHATGREGRARMVSIIGEAGIGKTRLSQELLRYIDGIAETVYYHSGRSPSYGDGVTFWALGEMIRQRAGILEGEDPAKSRLKLRTTVAEYVEDEEDQRWIEPRLAAVIGLAEMPAGERPELHAALRTFFQRIAERGTVLMVFEDLHWADEGLLDFVEDLIERTTSHPVMVIALARPELLDRRRDWGATRRRSLLMHLSRIDDVAMAELVAGLAPGIPDELVGRIVGRTAGVPLHAVEFVRMLVNTNQLIQGTDGFRFEGEIGTLAVPDSVSAIIGARLDRLAHEEATLVQDASVLGISFTVSGLATLRGVDADSLSTLLRGLVRHDVLELDEDPRSPERGQYRFVQGLIREVAYSRLSRADRVSRHLLVAKAYEELGDVELAGVVASHYASAAASDPSNVELGERARGAVIAAAERAADLHSDVQAASLFEQAIEMTADAGDKAELMLQRAYCLSAAGRTDVAADVAVEVLEWYRGVGNQRGVVLAATAAAKVRQTAFVSERSLGIILPVYEEAPVTNDEAWARLASQTSRAFMLNDDNERAVEVANQVLPILEELGLVDELCEVLNNKGTALANGGRWYEGVAILRGVIEIAGEHEIVAAEIRAANNLTAVMSSDTQRLKGVASRVNALADRAGSVPWVTQGRTLAVFQHMGAGEFTQAAKALDEIEELEITEFWVDQVRFLRLLIDLIASGFDEEAYDEAMGIARPLTEAGDPQLRGLATAYVIWLLLAKGEYRECVELALSNVDVLTGGVGFSGSFVLSAVALSGDSDLLRAIVARIGESPMARRLNQVIASLGSALTSIESGDLEAAVAEYRRSEELRDTVLARHDRALMQGAFFVAMPDGHPVGAEAGLAVREYAEAVGAKLFFEIFPSLPSAGESDESVAV